MPREHHRDIQMMVIWHYISTAQIVIRTEIILDFIHIIEKKSTTRPVKSVLFLFQIFREETTMLCMVLNTKLLGVHAIS
jgi:hypothetical protein